MATITLAIPRGYKNSDGEIETDFVDCVLWNNIAKSSLDYIAEGDVVGIRGRLETSINAANVKLTEVLVEKISFLSSKNDD